MNAGFDPGLDACTRCGLCLQACPTYRDLHLEPDSPRGRVFLMKQTAEGDDVDVALAEHLYVCLGCRACETACPSGVPFGKLLEHGRHIVESRGEIVSSRRGWRIFRRIAFEWVLPNRAAFTGAVWPARLLQRRPSLARALMAMPLPDRFRRLIEMVPPSPAGRSNRLPEAIAAEPPRRSRVGVFVGCVMNALFGHVHEALVRVLRHNGCDIVVPRGQWCCGALNVHAGERACARDMARRNIDAFDVAALDAIVLDSAGCGAAMKDYSGLLRDDPRYRDRAASFSAKVKDVAEFMCDLEPRRDFGNIDRRVTYQDACHLVHGQGIRLQPRALINMIPGVEFVETSDADRCCGAAGVYSLTHPDMAGRILDEKISAIAATGAQTVLVANPGCHMQIVAGAARRGSKLQVRHLVELLDEAYSKRIRRDEPAGLRT